MGGVDGICRWCMVYPRRWSDMSVWCGRYMEVVYGVPNEVVWYECVVGKVYGGGVWCTEGGGVV